MWGVSVPPESPSMNPKTGRLSATHASKVIKVAESQNGSQLPSCEEVLKETPYKYNHCRWECE